MIPALSRTVALTSSASVWF